jgi:cytochrome b561
MPRKFDNAITDNTASVPTPIRYGPVAQALHWVTVAAFCVLIYLAWGMVELPLGLEKYWRYNLHKSVGLTVLALMLLHLIWRWFNPPPPLPGTLSPIERVAATSMHRLLYGLIFLQAMIGVAHSWSADFPIVVYRLFTIPNPIGPNEPAAALLVSLHGWIGWGLVGLIVLHAGAALRHHFLVRDDVLLRILPGAADRQRKRLGLR